MYRNGIVVALFLTCSPKRIFIEGTVIMVNDCVLVEKDWMTGVYRKIIMQSINKMYSKRILLMIPF